jgi:predicted nucleic acid-binding protein
MNVLVDSSIWVAYFRGISDLPTLDWLIEEGLVVTNDIILAELTPALLVAQHAMQNALALFSLDKRFRLLSKHVPLRLQ